MVLISFNPFSNLLKRNKQTRGRGKEVKRKGAEEKEGGQKKEGPARQKDCSKDTFEKFVR